MVTSVLAHSAVFTPKLSVIHTMWTEQKAQPCTVYVGGESAGTPVAVSEPFLTRSLRLTRYYVERERR